MKKAVILSMFLFASCFASFGQNAKVDANGNYTAITQTKTPITGQKTGATFTDKKGIKYPVMMGSRGGLFYVKTSKTGNSYKVYIKTN